MSDQTDITCDVLIAGAGFSGAVTALALNRCNFDVCLVEKECHPRFTIGESSTPAANMILRDLSVKYNLPWLHHFSRYGSWQDYYPSIACGLKRGFSYYMHQKGNPFSSDSNHSHELLVAASSSNKNSDTNWLRSEFDAFLVQKAVEEDIPYFDQTTITGGVGDGPRGWKFYTDGARGQRTIHAGFFIDATGGPNLLEQVLKKVTCSSSSFQTRSRALFSHFDALPRWSSHLQKLGIPPADYPYDPDHSALHHLIDEGWMWMLRFNNGRTSAGIMQKMKDTEGNKDLSPEEEWKASISSYPSLAGLFNNYRIPDMPGQMIRTGRVQRRLSRAAGSGWVALPHTAGFVDPLHSTGIAHTLSGVEKIVAILSESRDNPHQIECRLKTYEESLFLELEIIDLMVAGCYEALPHFELFTTWSMLYFTATIQYEQERLRGKQPTCFLLADRSWLSELLREGLPRLKSLASSGDPHNIQPFREWIKKGIKPYNTADLMDPEVKNMYRHTAVEM